MKDYSILYLLAKNQFKIRTQSGPNGFNPTTAPNSADSSFGATGSVLHFLQFFRLAILKAYNVV